MTRDPAGYRSAVHHLAWLCVDDIHEDRSIQEGEEGEDYVALNGVLSAVETNANHPDGAEHVRAYLTAALDLVNLAVTDVLDEKPWSRARRLQKLIEQAQSALSTASGAVARKPRRRKS